MFILTTLDENYPQIWEKSGTATFHSRYEGNIIPCMQDRLRKGTVYAVGIYRPWRGMPREYAPSLLQLCQAKHIHPLQPSEHDIAVDFTFIGKLPTATNRFLNKFKQSRSPLIVEVDDMTFLRSLLHHLPAQ